MHVVVKKKFILTLYIIEPGSGEILLARNKLREDIDFGLKFAWFWVPACTVTTSKQDKGIKIYV